MTSATPHLATPLPAAPADLLRRAGLRVTAPRIAIIAALAESPHGDAEFVTRSVMERLGTVSKQAVYDSLGALTEAGILRRVSAGGRSALYEVESGDNHQHMLCKQCGNLQDVPCAADAAPCLLPPNHADFEIEVAEVLYRGLCPVCYAAKQSAAASA